MTCWFTALQQDKTYQGYAEDVLRLTKDKDLLKSQTRPKLRDLMSLDVMEDMLIDKMGHAETDAEEDKVLERITGRDGETYWWRYSTAQDMIQDMMLRKCVEIANIKVSIDLCDERLKEAQHAMGEYTDKFRDNFNKEATKDEA